MNETVDELGNLVYYSHMHQQPLLPVVEVSPRKYSMIAAIDLDGGYTKSSEIPWYYSEDFKWFKHKTENSICVMGKTTYLDINKRLGEKAAQSVLPNRTCYVVSTTLEPLPNATVVRSLSELNNLIPIDDTREVCIIGGGPLFSEGISKVSSVYLTVINATHDCDKFFPVKYLMKHFSVQTMFKGSEELLRYIVWNRKT